VANKKNDAGAGAMPGSHDSSKRRSQSILTTKIALRVDPVYEKIARRSHENPDEFTHAFART
jgi:catalase-peroxidase